MEVIVPEEFKYLYGQSGPVVVIPNDILLCKAERVDVFDRSLKKIAAKMLHTMVASRGIGIAAPQLGISKRIVIVRALGMDPHIFVNPSIIDRRGELVSEEGCLSIPGLYGQVERSASIEVEYQTVNERKGRMKLEGLGSVVLQHEIDHLDGVLFVERAKPETLTWRTP